ncbi:MAG: hypothetical protein SF339_23290 [Blastocatellia bacterium]|nr:hypothetical protein [Blastocatellia bacterium]
MKMKNTFFKNGSDSETSGKYACDSRRAKKKVRADAGPALIKTLLQAMLEVDRGKNDGAT